MKTEGGRIWLKICISFRLIVFYCFGLLLFFFVFVVVFGFSFIHSNFV